MSDWEIADQASASPPSSDWEVAQPTASQQISPNESLGASLAKAPFRVGEDVIKGGFNFLKNIPGYYDAAKTEVPGAINTLWQHPVHALGQGVAGLAELGQNVFNTPHDLINYAANRLNLVPQDINQKVQMARMPDSSEQINSLLGQPQYPGEDLIRGAARNSLSALGAAGIGSALNPLNLTKSGIAKNVLKEGDRQMQIHNDAYNQLWEDADKQGFNQVPYDSKVLESYKNLIDKSYPQKATKTLDEFTQNPTLENAQRAQSDLGNLRRSIEEKWTTTPLLGAEKDVYAALEGAEQHIQSNMFKNSNGQINQNLADRYKDLTNSYRENVVPYRYNSAIQAYKNKEITTPELINALSKGEFAAKKGSAHPAIKINALLTSPFAQVGGGVGAGALLYNQLMGIKKTNE